MVSSGVQKNLVGFWRLIPLLLMRVYVFDWNYTQSQFVAMSGDGSVQPFCGLPSKTPTTLNRTNQSV
jgi:hypothetical protein